MRLWKLPLLVSCPRPENLIIENNPRNYAVLAGINVAAFVLSIYVYPPLYKRFRLRPRPPRSSAPRGGQRSQRDAKKR